MQIYKMLSVAFQSSCQWLAQIQKWPREKPEGEAEFLLKVGLLTVSTIL